jgi:tRNA(Arg) A34 adenosine deaminase TadA
MTDEQLIAAALQQAEAALAVEEIPIGAVVARGGQIIAAAHNRRHLDGDPTAHAELLAIRQAATVLGDWRLIGCTLAVTLEPCCMCAGAIVLARLDRLVYGADDPKAGAVRSLYRLCEDDRLNHRPQIAANVLPDRCGQLLSDFFATQRARGKK